MKGIIIIAPFWILRNMIVGVTLWPFIFFKAEKYATEEKINHEQIHIKQQSEMLVVFFYLVYFVNFFFLLFTLNPNPYKNICFEKEADDNESDFEYLEKRKFWAWIKYI